MEEGGGQRYKSADFAVRDEALLERRKETTGLGKFMALERPRQQMMIMDGNRTNLHGIVLDNSKLVMLVSGIKANNTTRRTSTWHRDMKVQRAREARMPYRGSRSNPWDPTTEVSALNQVPQPQYLTALVRATNNRVSKLT